MACKPAPTTTLASLLQNSTLLGDKYWACSRGASSCWTPAQALVVALPPKLPHGHLHHLHQPKLAAAATDSSCDGSRERAGNAKRASKNRDLDPNSIWGVSSYLSYLVWKVLSTDKKSSGGPSGTQTPGNEPQVPPPQVCHQELTTRSM